MVNETKIRGGWLGKLLYKAITYRLRCNMVSLASHEEGVKRWQPVWTVGEFLQHKVGAWLEGERLYIASVWRYNSEGMNQ